MIPILHLYIIRHPLYNIITKHYTISVGSDTYNEQVDILNKVCLGPNASLTIEGDTAALLKKKADQVAAWNKILDEKFPRKE